jgi:CheY-like chemotaxis protein
MKKTVLDVGNCRFDHTSIAMLLDGKFDVEVLRVSEADEAIGALRAKPVDLVLVNRILDADGSEGIEVIRRIKQDPELGRVPVMLVSNYPEYQEAAVAAGAEPGFGKAELHRPETVRRLSRFLAEPARPTEAPGAPPAEA